MKRVCTIIASMLLLAGCVDENLYAPGDKPRGFYFTASIAHQDFYGEGSDGLTRSSAEEQQRVMSGFYDLPVDGHDDMLLSVSTLDGMFGKRTPIPSEDNGIPMTRGVLLDELRQEPMYVMETGTRANGTRVYGEPYTVVTKDGESWGGGLTPDRGDIVSNVIHAVYPALDNVQFNVEKQTVEYTTPLTADDQSDLLYSEREISLGQEAADSLHLTFDHMLTAVRFKIGSHQLPVSVIKSITISGVATRGTFDCSTHEWTADAGSCLSVSCDLDYNVTGLENVILNSGENTFMLLPQELSNDAMVTIRHEYYTVSSEDPTMTETHTGEITAKLSTGSTPAWEPGQCITYTLIDKKARSEYYLEVEAPEDFGPEGGTQAINVLSYKHIEGVRTPMRWAVQNYSSDGGKTWMDGGSSNVPKGMAISPTEGTSADAMPVNVTLKPAEVMSGPHREFLRFKTPLGYDGDAFDLSTHDYLNNPCAETTANCYVVDAPGKYRFPVAYGNGIVDGNTNSAAFNQDVESAADDALKGFPDYHGSLVSAPMIVNNGISLSRATLVWEDVDNLIDPASIRLNEAKTAIEFEILADNIDQGNAVIAVMDNANNIVWSWHIWVTDEKARLAEPIEMQNKKGESVGFMPLTLGWCSTANGYGAIGREAAVRITMAGHLTSKASFRIRQASSLPEDQGDNMAGNAPYYSWGRKDPFPGALSTAYINPDNDNQNCSPKLFSQAGDDAATLGMHAQLHVTYGFDHCGLFAAGAINAFNGFMTGLMVGAIYRLVEAAVPVVSPEVTTGISQGMVELEPIQRITEDAVVGAVETAIKESTNPALAIFAKAELVAQEYISYSSILPINVVYHGEVIGNISVNLLSAVTRVSFYLTPEFILKTVGLRALITIGPYAAALVGQAAQIMGDWGFSDVLSASNFWNGGTEWAREMKNHGVNVSDGILHPNILYRDPISWTAKKYSYLWDAGQPGADDPNAGETGRKVVKSIYDPCPAGYCVPSARDFSGIIDDNTSVDRFGSTVVKTDDEDESLVFPGLGMRNFWSGTEPGADLTNDINEQIFFVGAQGLYWTSSPAINEEEDTEVGAYAINFRGDSTYDYYGPKEGVRFTPRVINNLKLQQSFALPIKPVRENR